MELPGDNPSKRRRNTLRFARFEDLDRRTGAYREARRLIVAIVADLGGADQLTAGEQQLVQRAAVLGAILVDHEARYMRGDQFDPASYSALVNTQRRVLEAVGLRRRARDITPPLRQYLAEAAE